MLHLIIAIPVACFFILTFWLPLIGALMVLLAAILQGAVCGFVAWAVVDITAFNLGYGHTGDGTILWFCAAGIPLTALLLAWEDRRAAR